MIAVRRKATPAVTATTRSSNKSSAGNRAPPWMPASRRPTAGFASSTGRRGGNGLFSAPPRLRIEKGRYHLRRGQHRAARIEAAADQLGHFAGRLDLEENTDPARVVLARKQTGLEQREVPGHHAVA